MKTESATKSQIERTVKEWSRIAGEAITVEEIDYMLYAFGSELACLRLYRKFDGVGTVKFSVGDSWYFTTGRDIRPWIDENGQKTHLSPVEREMRNAFAPGWRDEMR